MENIIENNIHGDDLKKFNNFYYGREDHCEIKIKENSAKIAEKGNFDIKGYAFSAAKEETRPPRIVKVGLIQHAIVLPTEESVEKQRNAIFEKVEKIIRVAADEGIQIICLQETWSMPFFLCTKEKGRWSHFVESATDGPSVTLLKKLSKEYDLVIVSPISEDDNGVWWNTAVVIENGDVLGKHCKNHLPSIGGFSETDYFAQGNLGHPVFETKYGRLAINICYGRHQIMNWMMFGLNGAEIVFNPAATMSEFGESFWGIEARNAAIANSYYTCGINRVGTENFVTKDGQVSRSYYGSSYVTAPNGCRTPGLSRHRDGLLIVEIDLNLNRQVKDQWGFNMTARLDMYAKELLDAVRNNK